MGYMHIVNLYKDRAVLAFKRVYAAEKIHGTSSNIRYDAESGVTFSSGGEKHTRFVALFDVEKLTEKLKGMGSVYIYGEAYGGKQQGMADTYGKDLKFIAFDVKVDDRWLDVPAADQFVRDLDLEFVHYELVDTDTETLDKVRDQPSVQAERNGMGDKKDSEGVVLRPVFECFSVYGDRIMAKHKRQAFRETTTTRELSDEQLKVMEDANQIADEWVTEMRLTHVLDKIEASTLGDIPKVIAAMREDVTREAEGEIVVSPEALRAIGKKAAVLFKSRVTKV